MQRQDYSLPSTPNSSDLSFNSSLWNSSGDFEEYNSHPACNNNTEQPEQAVSGELDGDAEEEAPQIEPAVDTAVVITNARPQLVQEDPLSPAQKQKDAAQPLQRSVMQKMDEKRIPNSLKRKNDTLLSDNAPNSNLPVIASYNRNSTPLPQEPAAQPAESSLPRTATGEGTEACAQQVPLPEGEAKHRRRGKRPLPIRTLAALRRDAAGDSTAKQPGAALIRGREPSAPAGAVGGGGGDRASLRRKRRRGDSSQIKVKTLRSSQRRRNQPPAPPPPPPIVSQSFPKKHRRSARTAKGRNSIDPGAALPDEWDIFSNTPPQIPRSSPLDGRVPAQCVGDNPLPPIKIPYRPRGVPQLPPSKPYYASNYLWLPQEDLDPDLDLDLSYNEDLDLEPSSPLITAEELMELIKEQVDKEVEAAWALKFESMKKEALIP